MVSNNNKLKIIISKVKRKKKRSLANINSKHNVILLKCFKF